MKKVILHREEIYQGSLILVNRTYGIKGQMEERLEKSGENALKDGRKERSASGLVPIKEAEPPVFMERRAGALLLHLMNKIDGWREILPVSGWRSLKEQQAIWDDSLAENGREFTQTYVAYPGHSEHQTGLAIDLGRKQEVVDFIRPEFPDTGICGLFRRRAAEYGFTERYPAGKEVVTGIGYEPWHFRYVGIPHARIMERNGLVLEEYISFLRAFPWGGEAYLFSEKGQEFAISWLKASEEKSVPEIDDSHPYWISGNNVDGFIITQERSRHGY